MQALEAVLEHKGRAIHAVEATATVIDAVDRMSAARVGAVLVMEGDRLAGVFSERDLMTRVVLTRKDPARTRIADVMTREVVSIDVGMAPRDAMALMTKHRVRHLPLVVGRRIVGIVSIGDLVRWSLEEREHEIAELHDYVSGRYPG